MRRKTLLAPMWKQFAREKRVEKNLERKVPKEDKPGLDWGQRPKSRGWDSKKAWRVSQVIEIHIRGKKELDLMRTNLLPNILTIGGEKR